MKKEYFKPEMQVVRFTMGAGIIAASTLDGNPDNPQIPLTKEYNDVSNSNTTSGGSIWDNEW
jgi:hypothetical protein